MKKLFISVLAVAAAVACTKTNVDFEQSAEIGFSPVAGMISKAAIPDAAYPTDQPIGIWSNYAGNVDPKALSGSDYATFSTKYLDNVKFVKKSGTTNWGGATPYYWPTNGSLVFAGYSIPAGGEVNSNATYDFATDEMKITNYVQSLLTDETHDLLWFGRTTSSYNNRADGTPVSVKFHHALSWITIKVMGEGITLGTPKEGEAKNDNIWAVKTVKLKSVIKKGSATLKGSNASWKLGTDNGEITVFDNSQDLTKDAAIIETNSNGTVVLPQTPVKLEVSYSYKTPAGVEITENKEVELTLDKDDATKNLWKPGYHYIYTLTFKSNEILVAPTVEGWEDGGDHGVTVE